MAKPRKSRAKSNPPSIVVAPVAAPEPVVPRAPTHEEIAERAYELWLARGGNHGAHVEDWLAAERELTRAA